MKGKNVIYTAITGGYDSVKPIKIIDNDIDYICFVDSDFKGKIPQPWEKVVVDVELSNKDLARYCKINPHKLLSKYQRSVWVDGNIEIIDSLSEFLKRVLSQSDVASYDHWWRDSVEQEFYVCARAGLDKAWVLKKQWERYRRSGYRSRNFFENNVIFRNHLDKKVVAMHEVWWEEYINSGKRDQLSFTYSAFKCNIEIMSLGRHDPRLINKHFLYHPHIKNKPFLQRMVMKLINTLYIFFTNWRVAPPNKPNELL